MGIQRINSECLECADMSALLKAVPQSRDCRTPKLRLTRRRRI